MTENLPEWISVPLILLLGSSALYHCYIKPGYQKDKSKSFGKN